MSDKTVDTVLVCQTKPRKGSHKQKLAEVVLADEMTDKNGEKGKTNPRTSTTSVAQHTT